jgi:sporulation protein YlmC with PRC-barrel domain
MRLTDLRHKEVRSLDGERLGRVFEVHCDKGRVTAIMCGPASFIERMTAKRQGRRIPWEFVKRVEPDALIVSPDPPQRKPARKPAAKAAKPSASRSRQGTRRPSARRSRG